MPVYEFYCVDCHTIFNFLSRRINTEKKPTCPQCKKPELERQVSPFAVSRGRREEAVEGMPDLDEEKLGKAVLALAGEMEGVNENDPRQIARFMRRFTETTGMSIGSGMEEAIRRLESGEDPDKIESEMEDLADAENPFTFGGIRKMRRKIRPPAHDETLYTL
jgi:putative FmdB family regulatory protein